MAIFGASDRPIPSATGSRELRIKSLHGSSTPTSTVFLPTRECSRFRLTCGRPTQYRGHRCQMRRAFPVQSRRKVRSLPNHFGIQTISRSCKNGLVLLLRTWAFACSKSLASDTGVIKMLRCSRPSQTCPGFLLIRRGVAQLRFRYR